MWQSYFLIAVRTLAKNRLFSALNIAGLAMGMAACALMAMWVAVETGHDRWVPEGERVFLVQSRTQDPGQPPAIFRNSPAVMLPLLMQDFGPQIQAGSRYIAASRALRVGARLENQSVHLVDAGFFDVLPWPVAEGSTARALKEPGKLVVTPAFARRWFGRDSALGQTVTMLVKGEPRPFEIVAVLRELPPNTLFDFEALALFNPQDLPNPAAFESWGGFNPLSLVRVKRVADAAAIQAGADAFVGRHVPDFLTADKGFFYRPSLIPLADAHLQTVKVAGPAKPPGDRTLVNAVAATGVLVLVIATITYVNLVTARVSLRAREVGLRKTLGATRSQLVVQFLVESTVLAALAGLLALALVELSLPAFNQLLGQGLVLHYFGADGLLAPWLAMVVFVGLAGGWYPAVVLSRLQPRAAMSGVFTSAVGGPVRQALVVGQFAIAVGLMCLMAVIYAQVAHLRQADMGYRPQGLVVIGNLQRAEVKPQQQALLDAMRRVDGVVAATRSMFDPTMGGVIRQQAYFPGVPDSQAPQFSLQLVDWDYLPTYGARLLAGRGLTRDVALDDTAGLDGQQLTQRGVNVLVNRTALAYLGVSDPQAALGKMFYLGGQERYPVQVVGVLDDVRIRSARDKPMPAVYLRDVDNANSLSVRFAGVTPAAITQRLEAVWKQRLPNTPFSIRLVDDAIASYYQAETRTGNLFALFALLAMALCAAGLYGLAVFTAERRTREIGLRKLLGASTWAIVRLLLWQFAKPVLLALLIAWPVAAWLAHQWLQGFDVRIALTPWPFAAAGAAALAIAWGTVGWQALRVARSSPITALRHE